MIKKGKERKGEDTERKGKDWIGKETKGKGRGYCDLALGPQMPAELFD